MNDYKVRQSEIFKHLDDEQFAHIATRLRFVNVDADAIFYEEGAAADTISVVVDGHLQALKSSRIHHGKVVLCEFESKDVIGEMALLSDPERSATVKAISPSRLASFTRADFGVMERQRPDIALSMMKGILRIMSQRLQDTSADLADQH
jgi:CRP-like cAMP-binding protein